MAALAETRSVTKDFGTFTAVDSVDLAVQRGEVVGLLGANGAGKTTLIRLLLGLLRPSGGTARLFGELPSMSTRRRVGYVPQTLGLYDDMTVLENWAFTAAAFGSPSPVLPESIVDSKDELVGSLPLGLQRRVAFAVAFSHEPELLVLDEPTSGVGPLSGARLTYGEARVSTNESSVGARPAIIVLEARQRLVGDGVQVERPQRSEDERPGSRRTPGVSSCASDDS